MTDLRDAIPPHFKKALHSHGYKVTQDTVDGVAFGNQIIEYSSNVACLRFVSDRGGVRAEISPRSRDSWHDLHHFLDLIEPLPGGTKDSLDDLGKAFAERARKIEDFYAGGDYIRAIDRLYQAKRARH